MNITRSALPALKAEPFSTIIVPGKIGMTASNRGALRNILPRLKFGESMKEEEMTDERYEWISKRAYAIWEKAGRPWGCSQHHWGQAVAEREIMERTRASLDGQELILRFRQRAAPPNPAKTSQAEDEDSRGTGTGSM